MALRLQIALVALVLLLAGSARALTVAIIQSPAPSPELREALFRLQGELLAVGLDVAIARHPSRESGAGLSQAWLERLATDRKLDAIIDVVGQGSPQGVDVWVVGPGKHWSEVPRVMLEPDTPDPAATLAIRAIEVLRSRFVEFDLAMREQTERSEPRSSDSTEAADASSLTADPQNPTQPTDSGQPGTSKEKRLGLAAGAVVLSGVDQIGPALLPIAHFEWAVHPPLAAHATLAGFGTRPRVAAFAGEVRVAQQYATLGLSCCTSDAGLQPFLALSAGALRTVLEGQGSTPYQGHDEAHLSLVMQASLGLRLSLTDLYYLTIASHLQLAEPYVAVHIVDDLVATTGRPNVLVSLTVGAWL